MLCEHSLSDAGVVAAAVSPRLLLFKMQTPSEKSLETDQYGRLSVLFPEDLLGTATASGYHPAEVTLPCNSENYKTEK